jgi:hypothetical protein
MIQPPSQCSAPSLRLGNAKTELNERGEYRALLIISCKYGIIHEAYSSKSKHISRFFPGGLMLSSLRRLVLTVCIRVRVESERVVLCLRPASLAEWINGMHRLMQCMHRVIDEKRKCRPANINTCCTVHWRSKLPGFRMKQMITSENRQSTLGVGRTQCAPPSG